MVVYKQGSVEPQLVFDNTVGVGYNSVLSDCLEQMRQIAVNFVEARKKMKFCVEVNGDKWTVEANECDGSQAACLINEINRLMNKEEPTVDIRIDNTNTVPDVGMILARWLNP